jgi:hypothetical protein
VTFTNNTLTSSLEARFSAGIALANNTLTNSESYNPSQVVFEFSSGDQAIANTMDGTATGPGKGTDDNIGAGAVSNEFYAFKTSARSRRPRVTRSSATEAAPASDRTGLTIGAGYRGRTGDIQLGNRRIGV